MISSPRGSKTSKRSKGSKSKGSPEGTKKGGKQSSDKGRRAGGKKPSDAAVFRSSVSTKFATSRSPSRDIAMQLNQRHKRRVQEGKVEEKEENAIDKSGASSFIHMDDQLWHQRNMI